MFSWQACASSGATWGGMPGSRSATWMIFAEADLLDIGWQIANGAMPTLSGVFRNFCCKAEICGDTVLTSTVARMATPMAWTTWRVAMVKDEPWAISASGTTDKAVTKVVWMTAPNARPRTAIRNMIQLI